ncbi:MAG: hypothetical protein JXQ86_01280 [Methylophilaceae bacterium]
MVATIIQAVSPVSIVASSVASSEAIASSPAGISSISATRYELSLNTFVSAMLILVKPIKKRLMRLTNPNLDNNFFILISL